MSGLSTLYFPAGALIGLASAAPVGPVNLLVIQRTLTAHTAGALLLGAAGAVGDALFAAAAAFGVTAVARLLADHALVLRLGGGLIMLAFAVVIWRSSPKLRDRSDPASIVRLAVATLTLTLTNPATILFFVGAFGAVGFTGIGHDTAGHLVNAGAGRRGDVHRIDAVVGDRHQHRPAAARPDHRPPPPSAQPRHGDRPRRLRGRRRHFGSDRAMTDLAALVAMRLTHDLAGPLGAVATGIDLLDGGDPEVKALIADGAATAVASLRLHRFVLAPSDDAGPAHGLLAAWVALRDEVVLDWRAPPTAAGLVLGLAMCAVEAARRGGTVVVDGDTVTFAPAPTLDPAVAAALAGGPVTAARGALAGLLYAEAARRGGSITVEPGEAGLRLAYQGSALPR